MESTNEKLDVATFLLEKLKESENQMETHTKNKFTCQLCLKSPGAFYMLDCGHLPFCENCSKTILEREKSKCPECHKIVNKMYRAYLEKTKFTKLDSDKESHNPITID